MTQADPADGWLTLVLERHSRALSRPEFLKAVRALSARYVERRASLPARSPTDSAGKQAAFAGFFAPLHFLTVRAIIKEIGAAASPVTTIVDLGAGTGAASAAWALESRDTPPILAVDTARWALDEARWNWRALGLTGRTRATDFVDALSAIRTPPAESGTRTGIVLAWAVNEVGDDMRDTLLSLLLRQASAGSPVLVVEPLARRAVPWWPQWIDGWRPLGGVSQEWKVDVALPPALEAISHEAGFRREFLGARSLWCPGRK